MRPRLGVVMAALVAASLTAGAAAVAQISPGPLATPHAELDGSRNCLECHAKGQGVDPTKCLSCHGILQERIAAGAGLHAKPGYEDCRICHIDHHGRDYELIWWGDAGAEAFDHRLTGEPLTGKHRELTCRDCHRADFIGETERLRSAGKDLARTYLGLSSACVSCHEDEHRGQLADDCASCHATEDWSPAPLFDHDSAAFALTGAHQRTECAECHREESDGHGEFQLFKPVAHQQCTACHRDHHQGALGPDCASCHATESWHSTPGFDHSQTSYPLTGGHRRVACADCHRQPSGELQFEGIAFAECSDCHADPHDQRLGGECSSCHSTARWARITQDSFDHASTRFALVGAHAQVDCAACHAPGEALTVPGFERCVTCHTDEHLGQFAQRDDGGACESCHSEETFKPSSYSEADHQTSRFPLAGKHLGVACVECHAETTFRPVGGGAPEQAAKFRYESLACAECHANPHAETATRWIEDGGCESCHSDAGWELSTFDHATTEFSLDGAHATTACLECHESSATTTAVDSERPIQFADVATECASCHNEPHGEQFAERSGGCASCHTAVAWNELLFDHNRDSKYPLEGAHAEAACEACHFEAPELRQLPEFSEPVVRYRPVGTKCEDCHSG